MRSELHRPRSKATKREERAGTRNLVLAIVNTLPEQFLVLDEAYIGCERMAGHA